MATYNKFFDFTEQLCTGKHNLTAAGDQLFLYLSNAAPDATLDTVKADLAGITEQNGYAAADALNTLSEAAGVTTIAGTDKVWTASGGSFGPFRYVALYNETQTSPVDPLVSWWDYGSAITVLTGETFTVDFGASIFTVT